MFFDDAATAQDEKNANKNRQECFMEATHEINIAAGSESLLRFQQ